MRSFVISSLVVALCSTAGSGGASDVWESMLDDGAFTGNMLRPGIPQLQHDLEGSPVSPDQDWMAIAAKENHSYEARVTGLYWDNGCGAPPCPRFDLVDGAGNVLVEGVVTNDDVAFAETGLGLSVRWVVQAPLAQPPGEGVLSAWFLRAIGDELLPLPAGWTYDVELYDTTLFVPRWNNSATQTTVFVIQNTTNATVGGFVIFHDAAGTQLDFVTLQVPEHGVRVLNTASRPALAGKSGTATIAHYGGDAALTGKAVALEPATGFTFDTAMTLLAH